MNLRTKLTAVTIAITLLVSIVLIFSGRVSQNHIEKRFEEATYSGKSLLWEKIVSFQTHQMEMAISSISRDRATRNALKKNQKDKLNNSARSTYNLLSASKVVSSMFLTDIHGEIQFSAPSTFSGSSKNPLVARAISEGKVQGGLIKNEDGKLSMSIAFPVFMRGKAIGIGVYVKELDDAINELKVSDGSDVFILSEDGKLAYATNSELFSKIKLSPPAPGERSLSVVELTETINSVTVQPLFDINRSFLGHIVSVTDYTESYSDQQSNNFFTYSSTLLAMILAVAAIYWYINRSLKPLQTTISDLQAISNGDLTTHIDIVGGCEIGQLQAAMQTMVDNLRNMLQTVNDISTEVGNSSQKLLAITDDTEHGVMQQQSETESVAAAMNQMTATVNKVAENATHASEAAQAANLESNNGLKLVQGMIATINTLSDDVGNSSKIIHKLEEEANGIGTVVDVIRGIAEQTNLLALNAAIEAARAGEQGRGFAVVADEVRNLANRTQQSTQEIQQMIERLQTGAEEAVGAMETSRERTQETTRQATEAGSALGNITAAISEINDMNMTIASAAEEQTSVASEIDRNVTNISRIAEQSTEGTHQTKSASEDLNNLAEQLQGMLKRFNL